MRKSAFVRTARAFAIAAAVTSAAGAAHALGLPTGESLVVQRLDIYEFTPGGGAGQLIHPTADLGGYRAFTSANGLNGVLGRSSVGFSTPFAAASVSARQTDVDPNGATQPTYAGVSGQAVGRSSYYFGINDDNDFGANPVDVKLTSFAAFSALSEGSMQAAGNASLTITGGGIEYRDLYNFAYQPPHAAAGCELLPEGCDYTTNYGSNVVSTLSSVTAQFDEYGNEVDPFVELLTIEGDYRLDTSSTYSIGRTLSLFTNTIYRVELLAAGLVEDLSYYENGWSIPGHPAGSRVAGSGYANAYIDPMFSIDPLFLEQNPGLSIQLTETYGNAVGDADSIPDGYNGPGVAVFNSTVPEPGAWALMLTGFAAAGALLRRRRALAA
ncbi:MAG: hypothetical protein JWQ29_1535 [Phenylobacterium sp.]|nr:hypothetical protein [Phenylobacterium sp.]